MKIEEANTLLTHVGSEDRAGVLVEVLHQVPNKRSREKLLREWFNICDALDPWKDELRSAFDHVGFVTDTTVKLDLPCVVYRGAWHDDDVETALSWTLDRDEAERCCRRLTSMRAWFLGMRRTDATPTVFRGVCTEAYGYLTSRNESEVIAKTVVGIEAIAELVSAEEATG